MNYIGICLVILELVAVLFYISQLLRLMLAPEEAFEDHKHKLLWFLVVLFVPVVGAIWFSIWWHQNRTKKRRDVQIDNIRKIADAYKDKGKQ